MGLIAAIVGLALLVLIHEAGHFFAARAVGMTPRKFYLGFGPPIVRRVRNGVEYGIGSVPLGGYVKIPGMSRPSPGDLTRQLPEDEARRHQVELARLDRALEAGDEETARAVLRALQPELGGRRAWQELDGALAADAYWRHHTWRRLVAIGAGPAINIAFALVLFVSLFLVATVHTTRRVAGVVPGSPAASAGLHTGDVVLRVAGRPVTGDDLARTIRSTRGRPFTLVVRRDGAVRRIGPVRAKLEGGYYRIGIQIGAVQGPGESLGAAVGDGTRATWNVVAGTAAAIGHLVQGRDRNQVSSTVGIVQESAAAWRQGLLSFLTAFAYISLALGVMNLLPLLPLDGGHIVMALIEKVRGRTFGQGVYIRYSVAGLALLLIVMYIGLTNDIRRLGG
ncbi:MAG TPA: M50 family metallopeptidase [Gaiellaceae bacterium]|nr:M50 family metallopeptidase [Gaiellaceae bacterium]